MRPEGALETLAGGEPLWLLPQRAAYWPRMRTLLVADAHLGKAAAFRSAGVPVPSGTTAENLERLTALLRMLDAKRIAFIGDLVHDAAAQRAAGSAFYRWREAHRAVEMLLVRGNHDRRAGDPPGEWNLECVDEPYAHEGIALVHIPQRVPGHYAIAGHVHPAVQLSGRGRELLRLPCFHLTPDCATLPAFGAFTGMADVTRACGDRVYAIAGGDVVAIRS
jgi:DNA ligase-associated metallophosphoesterase